MADFSRWPPDTFKCSVSRQSSIRWPAPSTSLHDVEKCFPMLVLNYREWACVMMSFLCWRFSILNMVINDLIKQNTSISAISALERGASHWIVATNRLSNVQRSLSCSNLSIFILFFSIFNPFFQ